MVVFAFLWWVKRMIILSFLFLCCVSGFGHTCFLSKMPICILCSFKKLGYFFLFLYSNFFVYSRYYIFVRCVCCEHLCQVHTCFLLCWRYHMIHRFLNFKCELFVLMFIISYWGLFKQYLTTPRSELYLFILPSKSFRVLDLAFKSFIYLEFIFVHGLW